MANKVINLEDLIAQVGPIGQVQLRGSQRLRIVRVEVAPQRASEQRSDRLINYYKIHMVDSGQTVECQLICLGRREIDRFERLDPESWGFAALSPYLLPAALLQGPFNRPDPDKLYRARVWFPLQDVHTPNRQKRQLPRFRMQH